MVRQVNTVWMDRMKAEIAAWKQAEGNKPIICVNTSFNLAVQWLVLRLTEASIPFRLIQLGAGVKRVTTETDQCPKCHGTGRC